VILGASGNTGSVIATSLPENTTLTSFENFVRDVFAAAYQQNNGQ
jgi:hypothetical protein